MDVLDPSPPSPFQNLIDQTKKLLESSTEEALQAAIDLKHQAEAEEDDYALAWALCLYGRALSRNQLYEEAIDNLKQAHALTDPQKPSLLRATCAVYIGAAYNLSGQFKEASLWHHEAIPLCRELEVKELLNDALNNLGVAYGQFGEYSKTLSYFQESLDLSRNLNPKTVPFRVLNLGVVYFQLSQYQQAIRYYQEALIQAREHGNRDLESRCLDNLALAELQLDKFDLAKDYAQEALDLSLNTSTLAYRLPFIYRVLGFIHSKTGEQRQGLNHCLQSLKYLKIYPNEFEEVELRLVLGEIYFLMQEYEKAIENVETGLAKASSEGLKSVQFKFHRQFVDIYEAQQNIPKAYEHFKAFHELKEQVQDEGSNDRLHKMTVAAEIERIAKEREFKRIETQLKNEVRQLQIQIDHSKKQEQVEEITGTEYFLNLQQKARNMRKRKRE